MAGKLKKYFTVEEANQRLPLVRSIVSDIVAFYSDLHARHERLREVRQRHAGSTGRLPEEYLEETAQMESDLERDSERLRSYIEELAELGAELKDISKGLVDFPGMIDGREICLCWMLGEPEIAFWHETNAGFVGRQSLMANMSPPANTDIDPTAI